MYADFVRIRQIFKFAERVGLIFMRLPGPRGVNSYLLTSFRRLVAAEETFSMRGNILIGSCWNALVTSSCLILYKKLSNYSYWSFQYLFASKIIQANRKCFSEFFEQIVVFHFPSPFSCNNIVFCGVTTHHFTIPLFLVVSPFFSWSNDGTLVLAIFIISQKNSIVPWIKMIFCFEKNFLRYSSSIIAEKMSLIY